MSCLCWAVYSHEVQACPPMGMGCRRPLWCQLMCVFPKVAREATPKKGMSGKPGHGRAVAASQYPARYWSMRKHSCCEFTLLLSVTGSAAAMEAALTHLETLGGSAVIPSLDKQAVLPTPHSDE